MNQHREQNSLSNLAENAYWLALQDSSWLISSKKVIRAFEELGSLKGLWNCSYAYLHKLDLDDKSISKFCNFVNRIRIDELDKYLNYMNESGIKLIRYVDKEYPEALKTGVDDPPLLLFHKGSLRDFDDCVSIAGTRDCSLYGRLMAKRLAKAVASKGYTIVSGLARGIDEWAHSGALEVSNGKSIAVLPWIDPIYPSEHSNLMADIEKRGAVISERLEKPFGKVAKVKFVQRNRITSGISRCLIALESDEEGGTVHQVRIAISQGRKVFAVRPKDNERFKKGFKKFVDMGAIPIDSSKEVLSYLKKEAPIKTKDKKLDSYYQHSFDDLKGSLF
jgi:DNA processing protein